MHGVRVICACVILAVSAVMAEGQTAGTGLTGTSTKVEVTNLPEELKVRIVNPTGHESISVAVNHAGGSKGAAPVITVPNDHYFILTDVEITYAEPPGEFSVGDSSGAQLFLRVEEPLQRSYRSGIVFAPGARVNLERTADPGGRFALRGTFMGKLEPIE